MIQGDLSLFTFKILKVILSLRQLQIPRAQTAGHFVVSMREIE